MQKAGICAGAPRLWRSEIPCPSLKSVETNTCSRTGFESRNRSCFYRTLMHRLLTKTSGLLLVAVIGVDCSNSSRLTSKDPPPPPKDGAAGGWDGAEPFLLLTGQPANCPPARWKWKRNNGVMWGRDTGSSNCVIDLVSPSALRLQCTWNWIAACGSTDILISFCQYCSLKQTKPHRESCALPWRRTALHLWSWFGIGCAHRSASF